MEAISVAESNWRFPDLGRDLAIISGAAVLVASLIGAGVGVAAVKAWDWTVHRHKPV
jgi:hypothetical protein